MKKLVLALWPGGGGVYREDGNGGLGTGGVSEKWFGRIFGQIFCHQNFTPHKFWQQFGGKNFGGKKFGQKFGQTIFH